MNPPSHEGVEYSSPNEADAEVTAPIRAVPPSILGGQPWWNLFETPPPPPPPRRRRRTPVLLAGVAAAVVAVLVGCMVFWWVRPTTTAAGVHQSPSVALPTAPWGDDDARLMRQLPADYPPGACQPNTTVPAGVVASIRCHGNPDDESQQVIYSLMRDHAALESAFDEFLATSRAVVCPGNIQSPGPWRRNASPQTISGVLLCAFQHDVPTLAWTDDAQLVLGAVHVDSRPRALDELYTWWSTHS